MSLVVCHNGRDPYLSNSSASLKERRSQITHEGKLYEKLSYELKLSTATRLIKIIQAVALVVFSCLIALAFQSIRNLWQAGIKGSQSVNVLIPQSYSEEKDIWMEIASHLNVRDLLALRKTSTHKRIIAEMALIKQLNAGKITLFDLRIFNLTGIIDFFGENYSHITRLDLQKFKIQDENIEYLSENFKNLNHLSFIIYHLKKMI